MLSKEICERCQNDHSREFFDTEWEKGTVWCPDGIEKEGDIYFFTIGKSNIHKICNAIDGRIPDNCKFALEHTVLTKENA